MRRGVRAPVDRDGDPRAQQRRAPRARRSGSMCAPRPRSVPSPRSGSARGRGRARARPSPERGRCRREVDASRAAHDVAERGCPGGVGGTRAVVGGERRLDLELADRERLADVELGHVTEPPSSEDPPDPARHDDRGPPPDRGGATRGRGGRGGRARAGPRRPVAARRDEPAPGAAGALTKSAEQRVGEQPHAVERDQHGRVPDPARLRGRVLHGAMVGLGQRRGRRPRVTVRSHGRLRELSGPSQARPRSSSEARSGRIDERSSMSTTRSVRGLQKAVIVGAVAVGLAAGSYGVASAASGGSGAGSSCGESPPSPRSAPTPVDPGRAGQASRGAGSAATRPSSPATRPPR